jgi:hypothetical protein
VHCRDIVATSLVIVATLAFIIATFPIIVATIQFPPNSLLFSSKKKPDSLS